MLTCQLFCYTFQILLLKRRSPFIATVNNQKHYVLTFKQKNIITNDIITYYSELNSDIENKSDTFGMSYFVIFYGQLIAILFPANDVKQDIKILGPKLILEEVK